MPDDGGNHSTEAQMSCGRLDAEAAAMFAEVQRADTKATTLCGLIGGLLALDAVVLSAISKHACLPVAALMGASVLLGAALVLALLVIRPVLPPGGKLRTFACVAVGSGHTGTARLDSSVAEADRHLLMQTDRLALFTTLAQRKYRIIRWAVDITTAALTLAAAGLLILSVTI
ncbi:Pycsar system effector family protein [Streptomyces collinus]|uniref:Pycsar system effector family protein n=1 Tax=Streptomyces collinus TaxID=42684 RepID=UPI003689803F